MNGTPWTTTDITYLLENFGRGRDEEVAAALGRPLNTTKKKFYANGGKVVRPKCKRTVTPGARPAFSVLVEAIMAGRLEF